MGRKCLLIGVAIDGTHKTGNLIEVSKPLGIMPVSLPPKATVSRPLIAPAHYHSPRIRAAGPFPLMCCDLEFDGM